MRKLYEWLKSIFAEGETEIISHLSVIKTITIYARKSKILRRLLNKQINASHYDLDIGGGGIF